MRKLPVLAVVLFLLLSAGGAAWMFVLRGGDAPTEEPGGGGAARRVESPELPEPGLVGRAAGGSASGEPAPDAPLRARGRVVDPDGNPIPGARIHALAPGARLMERGFGARLAATSDDEGYFELRGARVDDLLVRAQGFLDRVESRVAPAVPVRIVLQPSTALLIVRVLDAEGRPLAGASVYAFEFVQGGVGLGRTEADGRARIPFVSGCVAYVSAWAPGCLQLRRAPIPPVNASGERRIELQLEPSFRIRGRVVDDETDQGIANAEIHSWEAFGSVPRTAADGTFAYESTRAIPWIRAEARGYLPAQVALTRDADGNTYADVRMEPSPVRTLTGVVLAADGTPVPHASVGCRMEVTETDAEGVFRIDVPDVRGTPQTLLAYHPRHGFAFAEVEVGDEPTVRFPATAGAHGVVRFEDEAPASGVGIALKPAAGFEMAGALTRALFLFKVGPTLAVTDAEGRFDLPPLPPGPCTALAVPRSALAGRGVSAAFTSGSERASITLTLSRGIGIEGVVEDADEKPLSGAEVQVSASDPIHPQRSHTVSTRTDAAGRFRLEGLPDGRLHVSAHASGYERWGRTMTPDGEPLGIRLDARPYVRLRITKNPPPAGTEMMSYFVDASGRDRGGGSAFYVNGEVRIEIWGADATQVRLEWKDLRGGPVDIPRAGEGRVVDVPLRRESEVAVLPGTGPRPSDGTPPPPPVVYGYIHGRVDPLPPGGLGEAHVLLDGHPSIQIQPDGSFVLSVVSGTHTLRVGTPEMKGPPREVVVEGGVRLDTVLAPPEEGGVIRGRVLDRAGTPVPGARLTAVPTDPSTPWRRHATRTDPDGRFWFHYLGGRRYRVGSALHGDEPGSVRETETDVDAGDLDLCYVRDGLLRGRATGDWAARPAPFRIGIERMGDDGSVEWSSSVRVQPDGDGFYFERSLAPGRYRLLPPDGARWVRTPGEIEIRDGSKAPPLQLELVGYGR